MCNLVFDAEIMQLTLFKYFKSSSLPKVILPCPNGLLSHEVPSTAISTANKEVEEVMVADSETKKKIFSENRRPP